MPEACGGNNALTLLCNSRAAPPVRCSGKRMAGHVPRCNAGARIKDAKEVPVEQLSNDTLVFLPGSRYCETDKLADIAWQLFGSKPPGWGRVQANCDFVCNRLTFVTSMPARRISID